MVLDLSICNYIIWSHNICRFPYITLIVVFFGSLVYSVENYAVYKLVSEDWSIEKGNRVLKCTYRYDMINKLVKIKYKYPCPLEVIDKINK